MRCYGKVIDYDGFTGIIKGIDGKDYLLVKNEVLDNDINNDDFVSFDGELYKDIEFTKYIARFVNVINSDVVNN